ncbi:hypothetical protein PGN35_014330 [Nodosilinea sp. PGN35]|uniref:hypothetical protein n=1 Tax=Nodosilinea sp. PGN35 TaxID=3020489 RepID=UPI0023B2D8E5|nr:hypothetical protein [Nodosilinea sp. TSF1-S3]MDF0364861.1 hypothetical protein [Nodosilinea sp. TSF1-S3]
MNRFVIGGLLAALVLILTGGLNRLLADRSQEPRPGGQPTAAQGQNADGLGTLPLDQAGRLVQRQSEVGSTNGTPVGGDTTGDSAFIDQANQRATISPNNGGGSGVTPAPGNVIPRTGGATTFPAPGGDVAPIQPGLVQPDAVQRPAPDPDLDSIPALW